MDDSLTCAARGDLPSEQGEREGEAPSGFAGGGGDASPYQMVIGMGGMTCAITSHDRRLAGLIAQRYDGFFTNQKPHFTIEVERVPSSGGDGSPLEIETGPVVGCLQGQTLQLTGDTFSAHLDFKARCGLIRHPPNLTPLDLTLKAIYAYYLLPEEAFFLHACAIVRKERSYLFFGPSGSGKSTLARLAGKGVLADELVIVRRQTGRDGSPCAVFGTPFWGGMNVAAPLAKLFALRFDRRATALTPLTPAQALRRLLPCIGSFIPDGRYEAGLFGLASWLVQQIPCHELRFSSEPSLERWLDASAG